MWGLRGGGETLASSRGFGALQQEVLAIPNDPGLFCADVRQRLEWRPPAFGTSAVSCIRWRSGGAGRVTARPVNLISGGVALPSGPPFSPQWSIIAPAGWVCSPHRTRLDSPPSEPHAPLSSASRARVGRGRRFPGRRYQHDEAGPCRVQDQALEIRDYRGRTHRRTKADLANWYQARVPLSFPGHWALAPSTTAATIAMIPWRTVEGSLGQASTTTRA